MSKKAIKKIWDWLNSDSEVDKRLYDTSITIIIKAENNERFEEYKQDIDRELSCCWHLYDINYVEENNDD